MQAIRNIYYVKDNKVIIDLPESFKNQSIEIIILPLTEVVHSPRSNSQDKKKRLQKILSIGNWDDEDLKPIIESQKLINQWKLEKF